MNYSDLPTAEVDRSQFIANSHQLLRSFFGITFPPLVRSPVLFFRLLGSSCCSLS
ncbi:hypothetical protein GXM_09900 [Nostoc sphaeroides CCNUC1]|uniref:Uncharacterized protein n=1 Tax=Nostoc sphaeroides CCNUC1 TaxID=2653204 RepID=A0A5P8WJR8_9NOSO|nr:hypothetical protein GXM_09900 [Nostoc sphaeroides CCNUC1]